MMLPELSTHFGPLALHRTACLTVRNQADGFQSHHQHGVLLQAVCIAQGHVVAEQQLPVPASWLQWDEDAMEEAPSPSSSPLQFSKKQQQGHETVLITGANQLSVEVCSVRTELPLNSIAQVLQQHVLATASKAARCLLWPVSHGQYNHHPRLVSHGVGQPCDRRPGPVGCWRSQPPCLRDRAVPVQSAAGQ